MAYIHNHKDPKVEEELLKGCKCTQQQMKEVLMKYGYNCEDIDEKFSPSQIKAAEEFTKNCREMANMRDEMSKASKYPILEEVEKILGGDRRSDYGEANVSFKRIADYWNAYLCHKRDKIDEAAHEEDLPYEFLRGEYLTDYDIAMLMILFKIAREENGHTHDSCVDIIGYTALADEMEE